MTLKGILAAVPPAAARAVAWAKTVPLLAWAVAGAYLLGGWSCHELARVRVTLAALPPPPEPPPAVDPTPNPDDPTPLPEPTPVPQPEPGEWCADADGTADYGWFVGGAFRGRWYAATGVYVAADRRAVRLTGPARVVGYSRQCTGKSCPTVVIYEHAPPAVPPPGGAFAGP